MPVTALFYWGGPGQPHTIASVFAFLSVWEIFFASLVPRPFTRAGKAWGQANPLYCMSLCTYYIQHESILIYRLANYMQISLLQTKILTLILDSPLETVAVKLDKYRDLRM